MWMFSKWLKTTMIMMTFDRSRKSNGRVGNWHRSLNIQSFFPVHCAYAFPPMYANQYINNETDHGTPSTNAYDTSYHGTQKYGGLENDVNIDFPDFKRVIFRFQPLDFDYMPKGFLETFHHILIICSTWPEMFIHCLRFCERMVVGTRPSSRFGGGLRGLRC